MPTDTESGTDTTGEVRQRAVDAAMAVFESTLKLYAPHRHLVEEAIEAAGRVYDGEHDAAVKDMMDRSLLAGMDVGPQGLTVRATMAREIAVTLVGAAKQFLDEHPGVENYIQQEIIDRDTGDRYTIIFVKPGGHTPHDLRRTAEAQRDQLRVERDWLLAEADDDTRARYARASSADGGEGARR